MKNKTIKRDFYNLVLKIVIYTIISTIITYSLMVIIMILTNDKPTDYYLKYIDKIEKEINEKGDSILEGNLIDIKKYSPRIHGEVIDINGNHLYGEKEVKNPKFNVITSMNRDRYYNNYIYRYISIISDNNIKAIYVIKAPFSFVKNNFQHNKIKMIMYLIILMSPVLYFVIYLFLFTSKLYKSISKNIDILLEGSQKICDGNLDFYITGVRGVEFCKIEEAFNTMVKVLRNNIKELSKLDEERKMMVSSIAHDIRTPITVIKGQLEIIYDLKNSPNYEIYDNMNIINKNCDKMINLTDNLSLLYKVDGKCFLLRNEKIDLKRFLKDKELEMKKLSERENITIEFKINLNKDKYMLDSTMLTRVLDNILFNSLRFTHKGKIILEIYDEHYIGNIKKINFKCVDTGIGFKEKDTSKLFEPFYQNENYKNHFGLGLYISKKIIKNFNGEIKAYNNNFGGATVEFYILELKEYINYS
ncbi:sensor histidine kinase YycG [Clostridium tepidiprofundi DSM 19306]|uniref:histidine kinase n=1 Tax=Clostridium tepidiprofundi DSM 19306 TaxID=1121338 RepID=A0A151B3N8_9CLOT|nr:HAMP domain-containing sensor histidine kinase [Clostridium tepidiprofundi]KYH34267.1 sensor histidine kinase YycG [Clostridium tepidiprofundi DSM 19306]